MRRILFFITSLILGNTLVAMDNSRDLTQQLCEAIYFYQDDQIASLIERGAQVDIRTRDGGTLMHVAALVGNPGAVDPLAQAGLPVDIAGAGGRRPMHDASRLGHCDVVRRLLVWRASTMQADDQGNLPIHYASVCGRRDVVSLLLERDERMGARYNAMMVSAGDGSIPLCLAAEGGHMPVVLLLLARMGRRGCLGHAQARGQVRDSACRARNTGHDNVADTIEQFLEGMQCDEGNR